MWFTENAWPPMLIAGLGALICLGLWNVDRRNLYFVLAIICLGLSGGFFVLERVIVTEGERLQADVAQLCDQFRKHQPAALDHFSDSVPEFKGLCKTAMDTVEIESPLHLTAFETTFTNNNSRANVHFRANAEISAMGFRHHAALRCILTYQKEGGTWKIVDVQRLDPIKGDKIGVMDHR